MSDINSTAFPVLSRAESHDRLTLSCGIFGLGLGATMVTGTKMQREALGTWNLNRMDMILDLASGILILIAASLMGRYNYMQQV